ncbi:deoxyribodipyrimidine photo-lyase [Enterobacteriaceae bacterium H20N1]|uniref:Deoxyribodipyrimidine photo-lyase n=1 Tax=Dryocola boscaweniae TaxID=2925397 RepID=A0A9X2W541_9ENTR|nr:deoxyribodipyrimidine photo-lyase [Dryocola boscaweniae]MCT4700742.1 deoxyribodipyrimidine photo-lyase [Dryocola boscaweniae]MCT4717844.1 deoxyribodipyrimidine photo-lyase [Dryocola boscaweniae]
MATHLVWFRSDLRVSDNLALAAACRDPGAKVIVLFIATPEQWRQHDMSPRQAEFLWQHLRLLQTSLAERGIALFIKQVADFTASIEYLKGFCASQNVDALFYNYQYEINERERDAAVEKILGRDVICQGFDDSVLLPPGSVTTGNHEMYKVFTPFSKAFIKRLQEGLPECVSAPHSRGEPLVIKEPAPFDYPGEKVDTALFPVGERAAIAKLREFCLRPAVDYAEQRDFPAIEGTSRLSPYLALGVISPRQCLHRLLKEHPQAIEGGEGATWLNELIWREFYRHLLVAWPKLCRFRPFIPWTDKVRWHQDKERLEAWQKGKTGFPIVDAAMRQLNATGWMHNRLRMVVASFLVKDLLIDWRAGERYFMSQLIDGDLAANNGGWQWAASTGTDAAPYFRIFNPTTQGERFDAEGAFIRHWLPELKAVPGKYIHSPWIWADKQQQTLDYPRPIVDHKQARIATLAAYEAARKPEDKQDEK